MHPFIRTLNDLSRYSGLDDIITSLVHVHSNSQVPLTFAVLTSTLFNSLDDFYYYTFDDRLLYPPQSLVYKFYNDKTFFQLALQYPSLFFKGRLLSSLFNDCKNIYSRVCSHSFSHIHLHENIVSRDLVKREVYNSFSKLRQFFRPEIICNSYVSPRNQISSDLMEELISIDCESVRISSKFSVLSENHFSPSSAKLFLKSLSLCSKSKEPEIQF